jgi:hypothetical protein
MRTLEIATVDCKFETTEESWRCWELIKSNAARGTKSSLILKLHQSEDVTAIHFDEPDPTEIHSDHELGTLFC